MIPRFGPPPERQSYRLRPGAYAVLIRGGSALLTFQHAPESEYQLPGGGIDPGESPLAALHREVHEETGVRVHAHTARYLASQPWPFPGSLMLGFIARAEPDVPRASE